MRRRREIYFACEKSQIVTFWKPRGREDADQKLGRRSYKWGLLMWVQM